MFGAIQALLLNSFKMKKVKMKDIILEHYQKVHELEVDGVTVRVWKPRTMQQLPAYMMRSNINEFVKLAKHWYCIENKAIWDCGCDDWGIYDVKYARYTDPRRKTLDIYVAALLIRPFSREARDWYEQHTYGLSPIERLMLMWDSREYDRIHGFTPIPPANWDEWKDTLYVVEDEERDLADTSSDYYDDKPVQPGLTFRFRHKDDQIQNGTTWPIEMGVPDGFQEKLKVTLQDFLDFTKAHPEFKEMHFYTEPTEWGEEFED